MSYNNQNKEVKAIAVARVSTTEQEEAGNSLIAQMDRIDRYCQKNEIKIIKRFEITESAYKDKRDEFDKFLDFLNEQKHKVIVCLDKIDRLSRNVFDKRIAKLNQKALSGEIEIHFVSDGQKIHSGLSAVEKFQFQSSLGLAGYYSDAISDNVKRAFEKLRGDGVWLSKARFGYLNIQPKDEKTKKVTKDIIPDPNIAPLIVKLFKLYATGNYSLETINDEMFILGLKNSQGLRLPRASIENMLKDTFYYGVAKSKKHGPYPHRYEPLISKELFDKCQEVLENKRSRPKNKFDTKDYVFRGLLTCKNCGCAISPETKIKKSGKKYVYYSCTNAKKICKRQYVNESVLLEQVCGTLDRLQNIPEERLKTLVTNLNKSVKNELAINRRQVNRVIEELQTAEKRKSNLIEALISDSITKKDYDKKHAEIEDQLQKLNTELARYTQTGFNREITVNTVLSLAKRSRQIFEGSETKQKRDILSFLFQNSELDGEIIDIHLRNPFNFLLQYIGTPAWFRDVDSNHDSRLQRPLSCH